MYIYIYIRISRHCNYAEGNHPETLIQASEIL